MTISWVTSNTGMENEAITPKNINLYSLTIIGLI